jgi:hypothetical protein
MFAILDIVKDAPKHKKEIEQLRSQTKQLEELSRKASEDRAGADKCLRDVSAREAALEKKIANFNKESSNKEADLAKREAELSAKSEALNSLSKETNKTIEEKLAEADWLRRENARLNSEADARLSNALAQERSTKDLLQKATIREKILAEALDKCRSL